MTQQAAEVGNRSALELVCSFDRFPLEYSHERRCYPCTHCRRSFPFERGVVRFLGDPDPFYEDKYPDRRAVRFVPRRDAFPFSWPLWLIKSGYVWAVRKHVAHGGTLVDLGCAAGIAYFARHYRVIGIDVSVSALERVADLYHGCLQADARQGVPLPDASVDAVVSAYLWEHIPPGDKPAILAGCSRALRPGGKLIFLHDVESENPVYRLMKRRDPELYRELLIEREGHLGWQTPAENRELFERNGFRVIESRGKEKLFISPSMLDKARRWEGWLRRLSAVGMRFRRGVPFHVYNAAVRIFDESFGRLLPEPWSRVVVTVCEKLDHPTGPATASTRR